MKTVYVLVSMVILTTVCGCCFEEPYPPDGGNACGDADTPDADVTPICVVPSGEYTGELTYIGGDCSWGPDMDGSPGSLYIGEGMACGADWAMTLWTEAGCARAILYQVTGDETGIDPRGRVVMSAACEETGCTANYTIDLQLVESTQ
jgi:hypothetical protein